MSQTTKQTHPTCPLCAARALACDGDCLATLHKSAGGKECQNEPTPANATGPRTTQGKAVAARNATTHGLFARDVVLPSLGEDPEGYRQLEAEWIAHLAPRNLLERLPASGGWRASASRVGSAAPAAPVFLGTASGSRRTGARTGLGLFLSPGGTSSE